MGASRPHIILIITDQQRFDTIGALGFPYMDTPHLDRLVDEGVAFTQSFVTAPSCLPSRASLFTGYYPHTTGMFRNGNRWRHSWVEQLREAGYYCVNIGKMHTSPPDTPLGFHERYVVENKDRPRGRHYFHDEWDKALEARGLVKPTRDAYATRVDHRTSLGAFTWELADDMHPDVFVGNMAKWWVEQHSKESQLFLQIGFPGPHPPYDPIARYAVPYLERDLPLPEVSDEEIAGQPSPLLALRQEHASANHDACLHLLKPTREQLHKQRAYYLANVTMIDEQIGGILQALAGKGYLDDAVVIFTSDHGDCLGDHGHSQKWTMYDIVTRVPLLVWAPGRFEGGRRVAALCQQMDIAPAILELAGIVPPPTMEAQSLLPALCGEPWTGREYVFAEHSRDNVLRHTEYMTMVRSERWKLVHFVDAPYGQLFDLEDDPGETTNLWDHPDHGRVKGALMEAILQWLLRSQLRTGEWKKEWR